MKQGLLKATSSLNCLFFGKIRQLSSEGIKVKPHIPLIRFRKGANTHQANSSSTSSVKATAGSLEETMTPIKYRRKTLSQLEIDTIEQGGMYPSIQFVN